MYISFPGMFGKLKVAYNVYLGVPGGVQCISQDKLVPRDVWGIESYIQCISRGKLVPGGVWEKSDRITILNVYIAGYHRGRYDIVEKA